MDERTEELGLAARLPLQVGGAQVVLRTLNLDESEDWLALLADQVAGFDLGEGDPAQIFTQLAQAPVRAMLELVMAYDHDGRLGSVNDLRKRMTQRELYAAVRQMVTAEAPFVQDVRSVGEAFGPQIRIVVMQVVAMIASRLQPANSTSGPLPTGTSTPELSVVASPRNGSSSSGATGRSARAAKIASAS